MDHDVIDLVKAPPRSVFRRNAANWIHPKHKLISPRPDHDPLDILNPVVHLTLGDLRLFVIPFEEDMLRSGLDAHAGKTPAKNVLGNDVDQFLAVQVPDLFRSFDRTVMKEG